MDVAFFGDSHGVFTSVVESASAGVAPVSIFLGDFDLTRPLDDEVSLLIEAGSDVWFVHGNHDADTAEWYDFVFSSKLADRNLSGHVVNIKGYRVAGLGGVFRSRVWDPRSNEKPRYSTREEMIAALPHHRWRGGLPMRQRATIFPEDFAVLSRHRADILITHEAPSSHRFGFTKIDELAAEMGVKLIVHGHHHEPYDGKLSNGIQVIGMGLSDWRLVNIEGVNG
jgi:predicted phosphodiesterase